MNSWIYEFAHTTEVVWARDIFLGAIMLKIKKELVLYCDGRCEGIGDSALGSYAYVIYFGSEKIMDGSGKVGYGIVRSS